MLKSELRQSGAPIRRFSREFGKCEGTFWRRHDPRESSRYMLAAERFERQHRAKGKRTGPLGTIALEVLRELLRLVDYKTGRLEPAIATLMQRLKRSKDAIVRALSNLRHAGFLDWLRRWAPTGDPAQPVKQATNAYRLSLPPAAERLLGVRAQAAPIPDDAADRCAARAEDFDRMLFSMAREDQAEIVFGKGPLADAVRRYALATNEKGLPGRENPDTDLLSRDK
jgi:hypothetical protein